MPETITLTGRQPLITGESVDLGAVAIVATFGPEPDEAPAPRQAVTAAGVAWLLPGIEPAPRERGGATQDAPPRHPGSSANLVKVALGPQRIGAVAAGQPHRWTASPKVRKSRHP